MHNYNNKKIIFLNYKKMIFLFHIMYYCIYIIITPTMEETKNYQLDFMTFLATDTMAANSKLKRLVFKVRNNNNVNEVEEIAISIKLETYNGFGKSAKSATNLEHGPRSVLLTIPIPKCQLFLVVEQLYPIGDYKKKLRRRLLQDDNKIHFKAVSGGEHTYLMKLMSGNVSDSWSFVNNVLVEPCGYRFEIEYKINTQEHVYVNFENSYGKKRTLEEKSTYDKNGCVCDKCNTQLTCYSCLDNVSDIRSVKKAKTVPIVVVFNRDVKYLEILANIAINGFSNGC